MAGVEQWVSDQLHSILGLSDRYVAQFLVNMAQKSTSRQDLVEKIRDTGTISVNDDVVGFMGQLWDKVPHKEQREKPSRARERAVREVLEQNAKYTLLPDSEDEAPQTTATAKKKTSKKRHLRRKADDESDEERPTASSSGEGAKVKQEPNWDSDPEDERLRDLKERDEFAARLRDRDKEKTRNIVERSDKKPREKNESTEEALDIVELEFAELQAHNISGDIQNQEGIDVQWSEVERITSFDGEVKFSRAAKLMLQLLAIPQSSAEFEGIFSTVKKTRTKFRSSLSNKALGDLLESPESGRAFEEAAKRLKLEAEDRQRLLPKLRVESRRQYLEKRKEDKLVELEADIHDEQFLFSDVKLTDRERKELEYKQKVLQLAKEHDKARELEKDDIEEYVEVDEREQVPQAEQRKWEEERMGIARMHFGARDAKEKHKEETYDLILDDAIDVW
ncbi:hypothetical protein HPB50_011633 [Hyalomma asiaticum]|uniref:Uncharacterized protein n=1 Tax=Hyalomma asiaticum TaxID=266040 RepID=A0ACB7TL60_HYAAI|nr:hypothetical protein HPB50_011633 [Hyalomma asiaticum]